MIVAPWHVALVLKAAVDLSDGAGPAARGLALRGALILLVLADSHEEARIALNVARQESHFDPWARNDHCDDGGTPLVCCGVGQAAVAHPGVCRPLGALLVWSWAVELDILRRSARSCGPTWERALTTYVSGHCGVALDVARARCELVNLCLTPSGYGPGAYPPKTVGATAAAPSDDPPEPEPEEPSAPSAPPPCTAPPCGGRED